MPSRRRDAKASTTSSPAGLTRAERLKNRLRIAAAAAANNNKDDADDKIADDHHNLCDVKNNNNKDNVEEAVDENGLDENPYLVYRAGKIARNERRLRELGLPVPSHSSTNNVGVDDVEEVDSVDNDPLDEDYVDNDDNFEDDDDWEVIDDDDDNARTRDGRKNYRGRNNAASSETSRSSGGGKGTGNNAGDDRDDVVHLVG